MTDSDRPESPIIPSGVTVPASRLDARILRLKRDAWNVWFTHSISRHVRRFWLRRILGGFGREAFLCRHVHLMKPENIFLGDRCVVNANCILDGRDYPLRVAHDVDIGTHTHIWTLEHDIHSPEYETKGGPVIIEDHVWVSTRVIILPGVTLGRGAVVAAGAVVTKDVPSMAVVAGVPARVIGQRDNPLTYELHFAPRFR